MSTTIGTGALAFTGISSFSSDFQTILQREQRIAQLPITALQNKQADNLGKKQALVAIDPFVASLASAVSALGTVASRQGVVATSSDSSIVSATNTGITGPQTYTISNIHTLASAASEMSVNHYTPTQAVSNSGYFDLVVGSDTYRLDVTANNTLAGLRDAINKAGAGATASILTTPTGNYLSISAQAAGATTLQLNDVPKQLVTATGTGTETSLATYADQGTTAVSASGQVDLVVGSTTYHLDLTGNNYLSGLADAITNSGAGVTASVVPVGGRFGLSIATNNGLPATMQLKDVPATTNLITSANQGTSADFYLNGIHMVKPSNVINDVVPGLSFSLNKTTTETGSVTVSLATQNSTLSSALQTFVNAYNSLADQVTQQVGPSAGALSGDRLIGDIRNDMQQLGSYWYSGTGSVRSLSDLGVTFDTTGHMSLDQDTFNNLSNTQISDAFKFLGSSKSGLASLSSNLSALSDPIDGQIRLEEDGYDRTNTQLSKQISTLTDRANLITAGMNARLQQADALVAQLQSVQQNVDASIASINYVTYGRITSSNGA